VRVLASPTIDVLGLSMLSSAATFDSDGYIIRMQPPLPADFEPPQSGEMTLSSGPEATPENRWSVTVDTEGLDGLAQDRVPELHLTRFRGEFSYWRGLRPTRLGWF
jgi:hypothetical protein